MTAIDPAGIHAEAQRAVQDPERLRVVRMTEMLYSGSEAFFDQLTRLAAEIARAPAAFLSLVDELKDFYKSTYGFDEAVSASRQLSGVTFCHYALISDGPLVIEDARKHPVFRDVPTVETLGIAAYLGVPLSVGVHPLGAFCVVDHRPRRWKTREIDAVAALARAANGEIAARSLHTRTEEAGPDQPSILARLSNREKEVLQGILVGKGTKEIALELDVSDKTVATHRGRLLKKLGLSSTYELYAYAVRHRLVDWI